MDNVFDHAESKNGLIIHAQKYKQHLAYRDRIEICIADMGKGIAASMAENPDYLKLSDFDKFMLALQVEYTSKPDKHTGERLSSILEWVKSNKGAECVIISKNHVWQKTNKGIGQNTLKNIKWDGTFIWLSTPRNPEISINEIWEKLGLIP